MRQAAAVFWMLFSMSILTDISASRALAGGTSHYDQEVLERGEIGLGTRSFAALLSLGLGFGLGHAVEGKYSEGSGLFFTLTEAVFLTSYIYTSSKTYGSYGYGCSYDFSGYSYCYGYPTYDQTMGTLSVISFILYATVHLWEFVDCVARPIVHNLRYEQLKGSETARNEPQLVPVVAKGDFGLGLGVGMRF